MKEMKELKELKEGYSNSSKNSAALCVVLSSAKRKGKTAKSARGAVVFHAKLITSKSHNDRATPPVLPQSQ